MKKIGFLCSYRKNSGDGQSVKTLAFIEYFKKLYGIEEIKVFNASIFKKSFNMLLIPYEIFKIMYSCENIIVSYAFKGSIIVLSIVNIFNYVFHRKIISIPVGSGSVMHLKKYSYYYCLSKNLQKIYLETTKMVEKYKAVGLENCEWIPNFREHEAIKEKDIYISKDGIIRLCTFSRVCKEKGVEDAIEAVNILNQKSGHIKYMLDIYGQVDLNYQKRFKEICEKLPEGIKYAGLVDSKLAVETLRNYDVLLFPTYWHNEGTAGTILDAFAAGVPIIASDWNYNSSIIKTDERLGIIVPTHDCIKLAEAIESLWENKEKLYTMKVNCIRESDNYLPQNALKKLITEIDRK